MSACFGSGIQREATVSLVLSLQQTPPIPCLSTGLHIGTPKDFLTMLYCYGSKLIEC